MSETKTPPHPRWLDAWHVNPSLNRDYDFIDGLRGIAILLVLCSHGIYVNPNAGPVVKFSGAMIGAGAGGIILFFAISGFLISWPFWRHKFAKGRPVALPGYAARRFWKNLSALGSFRLFFSRLFTPC